MYKIYVKKLRLFKGRSSKGIRGIHLGDNDSVMSLSVVDNSKQVQSMVDKNGTKKISIDKYILSITENGYGKRTSFLILELQIVEEKNNRHN